MLAIPTIANATRAPQAAGRVHVEDLLGQALARLDRRVAERQDVHARGGEQAERRQHEAARESCGGRPRGLGSFVDHRRKDEDAEGHEDDIVERQ